MRNLIFLFIPFLLFGATYNPSVADYDTVNYYVNTLASSGDIINIPADTVTWSDNLGITIGINLIGSGKLTTVITSNYDAINDGTRNPNNFLVHYNPANNADTLRISGITFDMDNKCDGISLTNDTETETYIRIDNCIIKDVDYAGSGRAIVVNGTVYGVIDNNEISGSDKLIDSYGNTEDSWDSLSFSYGTKYNIHYEDNTFTANSGCHSTGQGARYCARFNTYNFDREVGMYPWFDAHGNQPSGVGPMGVEIYHNTATDLDNEDGIGIFDHRGGNGIIFENNAITGGSVSAKVREEYVDSLYPTPNNYNMKVDSSYYWNNWRNGVTQVLAIEQYDCCDAIAENSEYFNYNASFDGTAGVGVGLYANMPVTCTTGVAYWATDKGGDWNKKNAGGNDGALYRAVSTDTWELYYTPYIYPHPLRGTAESGGTAKSDVVSIE